MDNVPHIVIYDSYKKVPKDLIDPLCKQIVQLNLACRRFYKQAGIIARYSFTKEIAKNAEFENPPDDSTFFLLMNQTTLAGFSIYSHSIYGASIRGLYVSPKYRKQGNGRRLILQTIAYAKQLYPNDSIGIDVAATNIAALNLYQSLGFIKPSAYSFVLST